MIYKTITTAFLVLILISLSQFSFAQSIQQNSSKLGYKSGHVKHKSASKGYGAYNTNLFDKHNAFHNKYYKPHPGTKAYEQKYYGNYGYGKERYYNKHKSHNKHYYNNHGYNPQGGNVYYGYDNYYPSPDYYGYGYGDPYYYGFTLGTVPERRSNLDVNPYRGRPEYRGNEEAYYPEDVYEYPEVYEEPTGDYSNAPGPANRTIYVWTDDTGVEHFVNDPDIVPDEFWGQVRVVEEY